MNEKYLEKKLREKIKSLGGLAIKFIPFHYTGLPDRIVLMPKGRVFFVELKTTGKKPTEKQVSVMAALKKLGFDVSIVDSNDSLETFLRGL